MMKQKKWVIKEKVNVKKVDTFTNIYDELDLQNYFELLRTFPKKHQRNTAFILSNFDHTILVFYDYNQKAWMKIDASEAEIIPNESNLAKAVMTTFSKNNITTFATTLYAKKTDAKEIKEAVKDLKASEDWQNLHEIDEAVAQKTDSLNCSWLLTACLNGDGEVVSPLINAKANTNLITAYGFTPLYLACSERHKDIVETLLNNYANINQANNYGTTPLLIATENNDYPIAELLLTKGANQNLADQYGITPIFNACQDNKPNLVNLLLDSHADINLTTQDGTTPLSVACQNEHLNIVQLLLDKAKDIDVNLADNNNVTPFFVACQDGSLEIVKLLLNKGADHNKLIMADMDILQAEAENKHCMSDFENFLIQNNIQPTIKTLTNFSPFDVAIFFGHTEIVKTLLPYCADQSKTPNWDVIDLALAMHHVDIAELIYDYLKQQSKQADSTLNTLKERVNEIQSKIENFKSMQQKKRLNEHRENFKSIYYKKFQIGAIHPIDDLFNRDQSIEMILDGILQGQKKSNKTTSHNQWFKPAASKKLLADTISEFRKSLTLDYPIDKRLDEFLDQSLTNNKPAKKRRKL